MLYMPTCNRLFLIGTVKLIMENILTPRRISVKAHLAFINFYLWVCKWDNHTLWTAFFLFLQKNPTMTAAEIQDSFK